MSAICHTIQPALAGAVRPTTGRGAVKPAVCAIGGSRLPVAKPHRKINEPLSVSNPSRRPRSLICRSSETMAAADKLINELLTVENLREAAHDKADDFDDDFFHLAADYLEKANKEQKPEVVHRIKVIIKVAHEEKEATLRPEVRLLHELLTCKNREQRKRVLKKKETIDILQMDDNHFHRVLMKNMINDTHDHVDEGNKRVLEKELKLIDTESKMALERAT